MEFMVTNFWTADFQQSKLKGEKVMRSTGIVRHIDELGRIVIPMELRRVMDVKKSDPLEILVDDDLIILQKYKNKNTCAITGEVNRQNRSFGNGNIVLSPEGAKKLLEELEKQVIKSQE